jgi:hypothetical protein
MSATALILGVAAFLFAGRFSTSTRIGVAELVLTIT